MRKTILVAILAASACGGSEPPAITVGEASFQADRLLGLSQDRRALLAYLTAFGLAVADSTTDRLGEPRVSEWVDDRRLDVLGAELVLEENDVGDDVLETRYLTDPRWELTVRHILFFSERWRSPDHRTEARAKAGRALERLRAGADFAQTAAELSEEPGAEGREGLLAPGREGSWVPEFWAAALALEPGEMSPVTETQYGFHILRLEDRAVVPFAEARSAVVREVADQIADPEAALEAWLDDRGVEPGQRRTLALREAASRGVTVPAAERAELERTWDDQAYRWSATLGFRYGLSPEQVAEAAFRALGESGQNAEIVRSEIRASGPLFEARYDIRFADGQG